MEESSSSRFLSHSRDHSGRAFLLCVGTALFWQFTPAAENLRIPFGPTTQCTAIGCSDQASLRVRFPDGRWPNGEHEVDVRLPDAMIHCRFTWPTEEPAGSIVTAACDQPQADALSGGLLPNPEEASVRVVMEPELTSDHPAEELQVVPRHFLERITITGMPGQIHVVQKLNGVVIGAQAFTLTYVENWPNGSLCGPVCRQASAEWELRPQPGVSAR